MAVKIKFGTDGWRALIAQEFTVENVARVSEATAQWVNNKSKSGSIVVGHDCRFAGELFAETLTKVACAKGLKVYLAKGFVSTPMISLGAQRLKCDLGVIITASHNPPSYNGYKLKGPYGGPLIPSQVQEIEDMIPEVSSIDYEKISMSDLVAQGKVTYVDLEQMYCEHAEKSFDLDAIRSSKLNLAYDAMYGAGQNVIRRLLPSVSRLHCDYNPGFHGQAPEPIHKNLLEFSEMIKHASIKFHCGLATDGDADRIGLYDSSGNFVDSHHIILLLIHYLCKYKKMTGKICIAFSVTPRVETLCKHYGLQMEVKKIGFKFIAETMINEDVLLGGEESGGIAIKGHIPERDGIWMGLVIWEFMAKTGKTLEELIAEVYEITGPFAFERIDLHIKEELKQSILVNCKSGAYNSFGKYKVSHMEDMDGWKYFFDNGEWLMIRASGTEPVLRTYAESDSRENAFAILKAAQEVLLT